jgi:hypothetical protein
MTMHTAIVVVQAPAPDYESRQKWATFLAGAARVEGNPAAIRLAENVWQIDFGHSPAALSQIVVACEQLGMRYGILPLADAPQWCPGSFDPKAIWDPKA